MYCDVYPVELQSRYSNKVACYSKVFIVSNWPLEKQYSEAQINDIETWLAFLRRITKVLIFEKNRIQEFNTVKEYFDFLNGRGESPMKKEVPVSDKALLTLEEASSYFNIGINKLRELTNSEDCKFVIWCGNKRLIKKNMFCEYLDKQYSI